MYFSRTKETQPWPPDPASRVMMQRSANGVREKLSGDGLRWEGSVLGEIVVWEGASEELHLDWKRWLREVVVLGRRKWRRRKWPMIKSQ